MNIRESLYTPQELIAFQARLRVLLLGAANVPLILGKTGLQTLALAFVVIVEWEIVYRVFQYLSGDGGYWSPQLMGLSAGIIVLATHILSEKIPGNFTTRFIDKAVQYIIPVYLIGIGLFIAMMLMGDEILSTFGTDAIPAIGELRESVGSSWIESLFTTLTSPASVILLSLGIGSLAIINIFVAHTLFVWIKENVDEAFNRTSRAKEALADHATILRCQRRYAELRSDLDDLAIWDDLYIRLHIAGEVINVIATALLPHKKWLTGQELHASNQWEPQGNVDPKFVAAAVKKIEAITPDDVIAAMNPKLLEDQV